MAFTATEVAVVDSSIGPSKCAGSFFRTACKTTLVMSSTFVVLRTFSMLQASLPLPSVPLAILQAQLAQAMCCALDPLPFVNGAVRIDLDPITMRPSVGIDLAREDAAVGYLSILH